MLNCVTGRVPYIFLSLKLRVLGCCWCVL